MLDKRTRKHVESNWRNVRDLPHPLENLREDIYRALVDLALCASMEPENHLVSPRKLPVDNVLDEKAIKPFLMALLDQHDDPHEKSRRTESKEEREKRIQRQRRLGILLVQIGGKECLKWALKPPYRGTTIGETLYNEAAKGLSILIEVARAAEKP